MKTPPPEHGDAGAVECEATTVSVYVGERETERPPVREGERERERKKGKSGQPARST